MAEDFEAVKNIIGTNEGHLFTIIVDTVIDGGKVFQNLESIGLDYNVDFFDVRCLLSYVQGGYVL